MCSGVVGVRYNSIFFSLQELKRLGKFGYILGLLTLCMGSSILFVP